MNKFYSRGYICFCLLVGAQTACYADATDFATARRTVESKATKTAINSRIQNAELFDDGNAAVRKRVQLHSSLTEQIDQARSGLGGVPSGHCIMPGAAFGF